MTFESLFCVFEFSGVWGSVGEMASHNTSDFQGEVGQVFGEIGGELPAKFGRRFSSFFCWGRPSEAFSTKTPPQISPSNFTTRFWVVGEFTDFCRKVSDGVGVDGVGAKFPFLQFFADCQFFPWP